MGDVVNIMSVTFSFEGISLDSILSWVDLKTLVYISILLQYEVKPMAERLPELILAHVKKTDISIAFACECLKCS